MPRDLPRETSRTIRVEQERADSQRTVSEQLGNATKVGEHGSGLLVVHRNESEEERRRRLKGKAIMTSKVETPMSRAKDAGSTALLIGRNAIIIREPSALGSPKSNSPGNQEKGTSRHKIRKGEDSVMRNETLSSHGNFVLGKDDFLNEEQAKMITLTAAEEAEVDKLTSDFDGVIMNKNMMENDDLLIDEPGYEEEQIEAISQLSPMHIQEENMGDESDAEQQLATTEVARSRKVQDGIRSDTHQEGGEHNKERQPPAKGFLKRKPTTTTEVKGAQASKKFQAHRGRSPKKNKGSGMILKSNSHKVPRHEVFPSAGSKKVLFLSGSVVSRKPPSKKI